MDIDPGDTIRYEILSAPAGVTINDSSGLLSWTPADSQIGSWDIITRVSDLSVTAADTDTFSVDVRNVNDAPVLVKAVVSDTLYEDSLWTFIFRASDIDSLYDDSLNFELSDHPALMQIDSSSGQVSWTPENADVGSDSFIVWVYDMELASDSIKFRLTIINTNDPPIIVGIPDTTALEDSLFEYIVQYEDVDVGDSVRFELIKTPFAMLIDSVGGKMTWTPGNDDRDSTFEIIYEVRDGIGAAVTDTFDLYVQNVNDAPVIAELDSLDIIEDSVFRMQFSEWFDKVSDVDNADSTLSWEVISFANLSIQTTVDSLILIGLPDWFGSDTGEVVISDGELNDTTELIVNILPVNDPPVIDAGFPSIISFTEDDTTELDLNLYVSDVDNDLLDLNWSVFPVESEKSKSDKALAKSKRKPFNNQLKSIRLNPFTAALINSEGDSIIIAVDTTTNIAKFYAKPDFFIDGYDFTFVVNDSVGQKGFGSDTVTATIQVNPANDPPVLASLPELYADEDSAITVVLSNWFEFVSDVDNHDTALTWSVVNGSFITAVIIDSLLSVSPLEHWFGDDTLQLIATDDGLLSDTADVIVHFQSVNDPPVFSPIADITVPEDETVYIELNDYVEDVETLDADLTFTVQRISAEGKSLSSTLVPVSIKSSINNDFLFVSETKSLLNEFSSAEEATGEDSIRIAIDALNHIASISGTPNYYTDFQVFTFYVSDGDSVDSINVNIAVASINDKPVLDSLSAITFQEDSLFVLSLSQWDTFVYDVEDSDDTLQWSFEMDDSISLSYDTTDNQITLSGGTNFHGSAVLTVIVADLEGLSDTSSVDITIVPINDPPQIDSSLFEITFDQKDTVDFILDNHVSDIDHSDQSLVWQFIPGDHVYLNYIDASRTVIFWSDQDWFGADTILAVVKDPQNGADSQFVYITVIDTTKPSFELAVFQNQLTSKYVEIDIFPSELLLGNALISTDGDTLAV
ncbi:MAG: tandem-95 repeat protein, partial [Candidatus Marinimicrobia bacterium]|nr:tandem-95 repeat protein [Candidatus Neomarinimicrobiota bacterium]